MFEKIKASWLSRIIIDPNTGCWIWTGFVHKKTGYGQVKMVNADGSRKSKSAHTAFYESVRGSLPEGLEPDHTCNNKVCVNPSHMEPVTHAENCRRRDLRNKYVFTPEVKSRISEACRVAWVRRKSLNSQPRPCSTIALGQTTYEKTA